MTMGVAVIRSSGNHCFLTCIMASNGGCDPLEGVSSFLFITLSLFSKVHDLHGFLRIPLSRVEFVSRPSEKTSRSPLFLFYLDFNRRGIRRNKVVTRR